MSRGLGGHLHADRGLFDRARGLCEAGIFGRRVTYSDVVLVHLSTRGAAALANTLAGSEHLGIAYLAAALRRESIDFAVIDFEGSGTSPALDAAAILRSRPRIVGFSPTSKSAA